MYCRSYIAELAADVYLPEQRLLFEALRTLPARWTSRALCKGGRGGNLRALLCQTAGFVTAARCGRMQKRYRISALLLGKFRKQGGDGSPPSLKNPLPLSARSDGNGEGRLCAVPSLFLILSLAYGAFFPPVGRDAFARRMRRARRNARQRSAILFGSERPRTRRRLNEQHRAYRNTAGSHPQFRPRKEPSRRRASP